MMKRHHPSGEARGQELSGLLRRVLILYYHPTNACQDTYRPFQSHRQPQYLEVVGEEEEADGLGQPLGEKAFVQPGLEFLGY